MSIAFIETTAVNPGIDGSRIDIEFAAVVDGSMVAVVVTPANFNRFSISVTIGTNGGGTMNVGTFQDVANAINASPAGAVVHCVGNPAITIYPSGLSAGFLLDGWEGNGLTL